MAVIAFHGAGNSGVEMGGSMKKKAAMLSIRDAVSKGITRLRKPMWANPCDHLKVDIYEGHLGPWIHLYAPFNLECNGRDPVSLLVIHVDIDEPEYVEYHGPLPDSEIYKNEQAKYTGVLKD